MKWPATEYLVFGVLAALPIAGGLAEVLLRRSRKQRVNPAAKHGRLMLLATLLSMAVLVAGAAYFWFFDRASDSFREWLRVSREGVGP